MPAITAVLHTHNDALRLGRALETLCPCDEILIIDHHSQDATRQVGREYGAKIVLAPSEPVRDKFLLDIATEWILCLDPRESLSEGLAAALFEWKSSPVEPAVSAFSVFHREETSEGWVQHPHPQTRLVPARWSQWDGYFPRGGSSAVSLEGELLRFAFP
jgi:glycosyltransferase involved in cell wall biosynthesis